MIPLSSMAMRELVAINGQIFKPEEAKISVFDRGFLYGDGVYEVVRSYGRILFTLEEHTERLFKSAERLAINIGFSPNQLMDEIREVYKASDRDDAYVRIVITRGEGRIALDPAASTPANRVIIVKDIPPINPENYRTGVDVITAGVLRNSKKSLDPNIKSGNYLNNILAIAEAKKRGAFDAIMVDSQGHVTEGTTWNIFKVKGGKLITPPDDSDILHGITRQILRKIAKNLNISLEEKFFTVDDLKKADEVFSTGSVKEIMAIRSVDGDQIGAGVPGPVTLKLASAYKNYVSDYCKNRGR